jgi:hypothetical protein
MLGNVMDDLLRDSILKIGRAEKHIADLNATILELQDSYVSAVEHDSERGIVSLKYDSPRAAHLVKEVALIFGDAIHNLRTSLDYAWVAIVRQVSPAMVDGYTKFPFRETARDLDAALTGRRIDVAAPRLFDGMRTDIKPYRGGNDSLCRLHDLDIADKHLLLTPVVSYSSISDGTVEDETGRPHDLNTFGIEGDGPFYVSLNPGYKIKDHGHISVTVLFDEGTPTPRCQVSSVIETLPIQVTKILQKLRTMV